MIRNYFADLELPVHASHEEVRQAYRKLARRFHPDLNPDDPGSAESFRLIQEAFEYLDSPARAEKLKRQLEVEVSQIRRVKQSKLPAVRSEKQRISRISKVKHRRAASEESLDLHLILQIDGPIAETSQMIEFQYSRPCPSCREKNAPPKTKLKACSECDGLGFQFIQRGANRWKKSCEKCLAKGYVAAHCETCHDRARTSEKQIVEFKIPKTADLRAPICLRGLGNISFDGTKRGDVWVQLERKR